MQILVRFSLDQVMQFLNVEPLELYTTLGSVFLVSRNVKPLLDDYNNIGGVLKILLENEALIFSSDSASCVADLLKVPFI